MAIDRAKKNLLISAALAGLLGSGPSAHGAQEAGSAPDVKCYGISKAGKNSCASATGKHSCQGLAKTDNDAGDWIMIQAAECSRNGGSVTVPAVTP